MWAPSARPNFNPWYPWGRVGARAPAGRGTVKGHRTLNLLQLALTDKEGRAGGDRAAGAYQFLKLNLKPPLGLNV